MTQVVAIRTPRVLQIGVLIALFAMAASPAMANNASLAQPGMSGGLEPPIDGAVEPPSMVWRLVPAVPSTQLPADEAAQQGSSGQGAASTPLDGRGAISNGVSTGAAQSGPLAERLEAAIRSSPAITDGCVARAVARYHVPLDIMLGIMRTEGGRVGSASRNTDGSYDLGPMQVNDDTWVPVLARQELGADTPGREKFIEAMLRYNACYNINMGFYIYSQYLRQAGGNYMQAVGYYNSHDPVAMRAYQANFARNFVKLFGDRLN